jgi:hypothetical protein
MNMLKWVKMPSFLKSRVRRKQKSNSAKYIESNRPTATLLKPGVERAYGEPEVVDRYVAKNRGFGTWESVLARSSGRNISDLERETREDDAKDNATIDKKIEALLEQKTNSEESVGENLGKGRSHVQKTDLAPVAEVDEISEISKSESKESMEETIIPHSIAPEIQKEGRLQQKILEKKTLFNFSTLNKLQAQLENHIVRNSKQDDATLPGHQD